eukprot:gene8751-699_t
MTKGIRSLTNKAPKVRSLNRFNPCIAKPAQIKENDHCLVDAPEELYIIGNIAPELFKKEVMVISVDEDEAKVRILNRVEILTIPTFCLQVKTKDNFKVKNR